MLCDPPTSNLVGFAVLSRSKATGHGVDNHLHLILRLGTNGAKLHFHYVPSGLGEGRFLIFLVPNFFF